MTQPEALYHLQEIDLKLVRAQNRLKEITAALGDNQPVSEAQRQVSAAQDRLAPLQVSGRNLELEIQSNAEKIRATDDQLYSGQVKNPKELQDMQKEIQSLKRRNQELEDRLLETMMAVDDAESTLTAAQSRLQSAVAEGQDAHQHLLDERAQLEREIAALGQQREQALQPVTPESLNLYNQLRGKKRNQPVAVLTENSCAVCGVEQTLAIAKSLRQGQGFVYCTNCGRILVAK